MNYDTDIAIVGGGLNGAMMGLALVEAGLMEDDDVWHLLHKKPYL